MTVSCLHLLKTISSLCCGSSAEEDVNEVIIILNSIRTGKLLVTVYVLCLYTVHLNQLFNTLKF